MNLGIKGWYCSRLPFWCSTLSHRILGEQGVGLQSKVTANRNKSYDHSSCQPHRVSGLHLQIRSLLFRSLCCVLGASISSKGRESSTVVPLTIRTIFTRISSTQLRSRRQPPMDARYVLYYAITSKDQRIMYR